MLMVRIRGSDPLSLEGTVGMGLQIGAASVDRAHGLALDHYGNLLLGGSTRVVGDRCGRGHLCVQTEESKVWQDDMFLLQLSDLWCEPGPGGGLPRWRCHLRIRPYPLLYKAVCVTRRN